MPISGRPWLPTARLQSSARAQCSNSEALTFDTSRLEIRFVLPFGQRFAFEERDRFVQHGRVAGGFDELDDGIGQPEQVVGDARAHSAPRRRMPPMLHVTLDKLARSRPQEMFARKFALRNRQRHHVLELIAKTVRAADLIESRRAPRCGTKASDRAASDLGARPWRDRAS